MSWRLGIVKAYVRYSVRMAAIHVQHQLALMKLEALRVYLHLFGGEL